MALIWSINYPPLHVKYRQMYGFCFGAKRKQIGGAADEALCLNYAVATQRSGR